MEEENYEVVTAYSGAQGLQILEKGDISLVILDIMMPGMNGMEVCDRIREFSNIPIIMVSAKGQEQDKISGLREGADDYIVKPFSVAELIARVHSQLRRYTYFSTQGKKDSHIHVKGLSIDEGKASGHVIWRKNQTNANRIFHPAFTG